MECQRKRRRRGRGHSYVNQTMPNHPYFSPHSSQKWNFSSSLTSFLIMTSLIGIIYLMLDYQCASCAQNYDRGNLTKSVEQIVHHLSLMKNSYYDLDMKISNFYQELPKVEKHIEMLEALANTIEHKEFGWELKAHSTRPHVDVFVAKTVKDEPNLFCKSIPILTPNLTTPQPITVDQD